MAGIGPLGALVMIARLGVASMREIEQSALQFDPGVRSHLLGGQFVLGFGEKPIGLRGIAHLEFEVGQPREIVPRSIALDHVQVSGFRLRVAALLEIEVGQQGLGLGARRERRVGAEIAPHVVEPVQLERQIGLEEIKIAGKGICRMPSSITGSAASSAPRFPVCTACW